MTRHASARFSRAARAACGFAAALACFAALPAIAAAATPDAIYDTTPSSTDMKGGYQGVTPQLNVAIPGLQLATKIDLLNERTIVIPFLAQYVAAVFSYAVGISTVAAAIMIVYGGFLYINATTIGNVTKGKQIITDAIFGLLLLFGTYSILGFINPNLITLQAIRVPLVKPDPLESGNYNFVLRLGDTPPPKAGAPTPPIQRSSDGGPKESPRGSKQEIAEAIREGAKMAGVDPCVMMAICWHETRWQPIWNGYPGNPKENAKYFGLCGTGAFFLHEKNIHIKDIRSKFPDFPAPNESGTSKMTKSEVMARGDWLVSNLKGGAYVGALMFTDAVQTTKNSEVAAIAGYSAGPTSILMTAKANNCTIASGKKIKDYVGNPDAALQEACIPQYVTVFAGGRDPCPGSRCVEFHVDSKSQFVGHCENDANAVCYGMLTDGYLKDVLAQYPQMVKDYQCDK